MASRREPVRASRVALALRHVAFEDLGVIAPLLLERGYEVRYADAGIDPLDTSVLMDADVVIVLGGPVGVHDAVCYPFLADEARGIAERVGQNLPTLGICLGAQLIAAALGSVVRPSGQVEIGYGPLTLTAAGKRGVLSAMAHQPVLHWHGDEFVTPEDAVRLAETPGFPHQAFSVGTQILGLQFHLETDHAQIERWLVGHAHELAVRGIDPRRIRDDAKRYGPALATCARAVIGRWLDSLGRTSP